MAKAFDFIDGAEAANAQAAELKRRGVHAVVLLIHEGVRQRGDGSSDPNGCVSPGGDLEGILARLSDDIRLGQRRTFSRAPISLPAVVKTTAGEWTTHTRDVSAGGVCVAREGADPGEGSLQVRIQVANHEVVAEARAVRVTNDDLGLRFEVIERDDRMLLASLALAYHRRR